MAALPATKRIGEARKELHHFFQVTDAVKGYLERQRVPVVPQRQAWKLNNVWLRVRKAAAKGCQVQTSLTPR